MLGLVPAMMAVLLVVACGPPRVRASPRAEPAPPPQSGAAFEFRDVNGHLVSSASTRGRVLCVLFVTTYDLASQVQARRLDQVVAAYAARASGMLVVLEMPSYAPFAATFGDSLGIALPIVMADPETLAGRGPFGKIERVPTLVVFDGGGREKGRRSGLLTRQEIATELLRAIGEEGP
ncbi:MAG: hypothetical protein JW751_10185 [Polyangiaceae bacterium]|nr:hypothetical protein [Polyangiaceae bacterium]